MTEERDDVQEPQPDPLKDRIAGVEMVYHQVMGEQPKMIETRYSGELETTEQLFQRSTKVKEGERKALDFGWIEDIGHIIIRNEEGKPGQVNPSPEERALMKRKLLRVYVEGSGDDYWVVHPGMTLKGYFSSPEKIRLAAAPGAEVVRYSIHVFPR